MNEQEQVQHEQEKRQSPIQHESNIVEIDTLGVLVIIK